MMNVTGRLGAVGRTATKPFAGTVNLTVSPAKVETAPNRPAEAPKKKKGFWGKLWDGVKSAAKAVWNGVVKPALQQAWETVKQIGRNALDSLLTKGTDWLSGKVDKALDKKEPAV